MPLEAVLTSQDAWARTRWPGHTGRRAPSLAANLIVPMSPEVRDQFSNGSGGELGQYIFCYLSGSCLRCK